MENNWYEWLKNQVNNRGVNKSVDCAFMHGQIIFACVAGLITEEQKDELTAMIPEY